jgi:hypothetical protein
LREEHDVAKNSRPNQSSFELHICSGSIAKSDSRPRSAYSQISIDGEEIETCHTVCLDALVSSLERGGTYQIFTCGCGAAGCAGIFDGVEVSHSKREVLWALRRPLSSVGFGEEEVRYEAWARRVPVSRFVFNRAEMVQNIAQALAFADHTHHPRCSYSPYGFERADITRLANQISRIK